MIQLRALKATGKSYESGIAQPGDSYTEYDAAGIAAVLDGRATADPAAIADARRRLAAAGVSIATPMGKR